MFTAELILDHDDHAFNERHDRATGFRRSMFEPHARFDEQLAFGQTLTTSIMHVVEGFKDATTAAL